MPHSQELKLTERFTRIDPDMIDYGVIVNNPRTYTAPWTFLMTLTTQPGYEVLEYSCHEGNNFIRTALRAEQQYQQKVADARAKGEPIPERPRPRNTGGGIGIFAPPSETEALEIGTVERRRPAWARTRSIHALALVRDRGIVTRRRDRATALRAP